MLIAIVAAALVALWLLLHLKTSRPDGDLVRVHPYRRIMFYIMRTRNESVVYFDEYVDARPLLDYLPLARAKFGADVTHLAVAAGLVGLAANPRMNRFVVGQRLYQRRERAVTFSMKRKVMDRKAKLATVKLAGRDGETFAELCARINAAIHVERSDAVTHADKEFRLLNLMPRPVFRAAVRLLRGLDACNLLPGAFIRTDPLYTSLFVANLGSLGMAPGFHHLYEYGTCPVFLMVGAIEDAPVVEDGALVVRPRLHLRFSYDERIDDGLSARFGIEAVERVLADPFRWLGCVADDGSDARPLWPREDWAQTPE